MHVECWHDEPTLVVGRRRGANREINVAVGVKKPAKNAGARRSHFDDARRSRRHDEPRERRVGDVREIRLRFVVKFGGRLAAHSQRAGGRAASSRLFCAAPLRVDIFGAELFAETKKKLC